MIRKAFRIRTAVYLQNCLLQVDTAPLTPPVIGGLSLSVTNVPFSQSGTRQIAPVFVGIQWDLLIDSRRSELEREVLAELQRTVFSRKRQSWLAIFFTIYVLLSTLEETLWSHYAWKIKGWGPRAEFTEQRAQEISNVFVAVFRAINQGARPLTQDTDGEDIAKAVRDGYGEPALVIFEALRELVRLNGE